MRSIQRSLFGIFLLIFCFSCLNTKRERKEREVSRQEKTREVIRQLKIIREERGLSIQRIADMTEANGNAVSPATVRRVFETGSEDRNFRYEDSIKPIADVLLEVQSTEAATAADTAEVDALRALVRYKNAYISELEAASSNVDAKIQTAKAEAQLKIEFLKKEIEMRDKILDERRDFIFDLQAVRDRFRKTTITLTVLLFLSMFGVIVALLSDSILRFF